jgi:multiple sugar transport system substrate-binding protein
MAARKLVLVVFLSLLVFGAAASVVSQEQVTISFSTWDTGTGLEITQGILDGYMEASGVNVVTEHVEGFADPSILVRMAAGTAPDVMLTGGSAFPRQALAPEGGFMDLTERAANDPDFHREDYYPEVYDMGVIDGKLYAMPQTFATLAFYVNVDMFEAANIPIPDETWTYDDLIEIAKELTLDANGNNANSPAFDPENIVQYGWFHASNWLRPWEAIVYSQGGTVLNEDGSEATGYLNGEPVYNALDLYRNAAFEWHIAPTVAAMEAQPGVDLFASGQVAIYGPMGPWPIRQYSENPDLNFANVPNPAGPGGRIAVTTWAGHAVNVNTQHPDEAWELVKYMATVGQNSYVEWGLVPHIEASTASGQSTDPYQGVFIGELEVVHPLDEAKTYLYTECINTPMSSFLQAVNSEGALDLDLQAELDSIAADADTCLQQSM